jgi:DNA-directed RNA polymerase beta subunit
VQLEAAGFAKYGQEKMISGVTGEEMACDIYIGVVYYQRLRHMVSDKFQVGFGGGWEGGGGGKGGGGEWPC